LAEAVAQYIDWEAQVVGVGVVVNGWLVGPAGIPIAFPRSLLLRSTFVTQRGALDAREAAMELGVELMKVRVFDEIGVNLDDTVRPDTLDSARICFGISALARGLAAIEAP
jgi:hypothetical protein